MIFHTDNIVFQVLNSIFDDWVISNNIRHNGSFFQATFLLGFKSQWQGISSYECNENETDGNAINIKPSKAEKAFNTTERWVTIEEEIKCFNADSNT